MLVCFGLFTGFVHKIKQCDIFESKKRQKANRDHKNTS